jgi:hypothetical protein
MTRYLPEELHGKFGEPFLLVDRCFELHSTLWVANSQYEGIQSWLVTPDR